MQLQNGQPPLARLSLVGRLEETPVRAREVEAYERARREIARENHAARLMGPDDARWLLAQDAERALEGGRAAIIRPEVRRRLVNKATSAGLRPFDANLVIAIVQDAARRGEPGPAAASLAMVGPARRADWTVPAKLAVAVGLGVAGFAALVAWFGA
jgi:hypothetical protein